MGQFLTTLSQVYRPGRPPCKGIKKGFFMCLEGGYSISLHLFIASLQKVVFWSIFPVWSMHISPPNWMAVLNASFVDFGSFQYPPVRGPSTGSFQTEGMRTEFYFSTLINSKFWYCAKKIHMPQGREGKIFKYQKLHFQKCNFLNLIFQFSRKTQIFFILGMGFDSLNSAEWTDLIRNPVTSQEKNIALALFFFTP